MISVVLKKMTEDHLDDVLRIYNHYILHSTATFHSQPLTADELRELIFFDNPRYQTYVLCCDKECCGYVFLNQHKKREAYDATGEISVYLKPGYSGKGLGRLAIDHIEQHARQHSFHVLLATISSQNKDSLKLFEKAGFQRCAHFREVGRKFGQWLDIIVLQKILSVSLHEANPGC